jgi:hypothetical protein
MRAGIPLALNRFRGRAQHLNKAGQEIFTGMLAILSAAPWKFAGRRLPNWTAPIFQVGRRRGRCQPVTTMLGPLPYVGGNSGDRRVD